MICFGEVPAGAVLPIYFDSFASSTGAPITITGLATTDIEVVKGTSVTVRASDAGYALLDTDGIDIGGRTGIHGFTIDTGDNTDAGFYAVGSFFTVLVDAVTIDSQTVRFVAATFRIKEGETTTGRIEARVASIANDAVTAAAIADNAIDAGAIASNAITSAKIADGAITAAKIATDAIDADAIADGAITAASFAAGAIDATAIATGAIDADALAADAVDEIWDEVVDGSVTARQSLRLANSANGGKASGMETTNPLIRDLADTKTRINATVDADGNRSAVTLDLT